MLRIVHLEDDANDRELVAAALQADGLECAITAVQTRDAFQRALADGADLILADYSLPGFDGLQAQELALARCPEVPFVFVSGAIGDDLAVERLKRGATDYVLKHRLEKLPLAVRRAIDEATERRKRWSAEAELRALTVELERRVEARTRELVAANDALRQAREAADRASLAKSDFLSRMSHDLRTPLNAIMGFAQVLQLDPLTPDQADSVLQIVRGGQHVLNLITEVLDIARIEAGHLTLSPEPVAVLDSLSASVALIEPLAARRDIVVTTTAPPGLYVRADRQRLSQILLNLLSNAVKYNRHGGRVRVAAERQADDTVRLDVVDTGAGLPEGKRALLFQPFERLGAEASGIEGTGLGLALSRGLAEAMGGTLTFESTVDVGTTLHLTLPACEGAPDASPSPLPLPEAPVTVRGTVLYIEDNAANASLMRRLLERRPQVTLHHAADGTAGLEAVHAVRPGLVILDLHLADMDGEEVLRRIWENPDTRPIPVVVLSGDASNATQRRLLAAGAFKYLTKPFSIAQVLAVVDEVLGKDTESS